jgi:2-aminobenzoate-CoA ligase
MSKSKTSHIDTFCAEALPPRDLWPEIDLGTLQYPERLNCVSELLDKHIAEGNGDRVVFRHPAGNWSYAELQQAANRIANFLTKDLGMVSGNRVLLRGANTPMMAACWLGVLKAGGVVVCTMPVLRQRELTYIAEKARINIALCDGRVAEDCKAAMQAVNATAPVVCFYDMQFEGCLEQRIATHSVEYTNSDTAAEDTAIIAFTSGTTGKSKGTMHSHRDILAICDTFGKHILRATADDVFCGSPPIAFTYALGGLLLFPLRVGASTILVEQGTPPHLLKTIQEFRATISFTSPTGYRGMMKLLKDYDISSLRKCVSAGETLPQTTYEAWLKATGIRIIDGIGSTEMLHIFISSPEEEIRPGSTGRVVPGYQATLFDDDGHEVNTGEVGRLAVRGPTGARYLDNVEQQQRYVQHGWNLTGDSYRRDAEGYFWYQARTDDMIITSGYNVAGPEVENVLLEHASVAECAVVGVPDDERGQLVTAFIVLVPGHTGSPDLTKQLQDFVKSQIAPYKYPRAVEFVTALPRTDTGKVQRFRLRESS